MANGRRRYAIESWDQALRVAFRQRKGRLGNLRTFFIFGALTACTSSMRASSNTGRNEAEWLPPLIVEYDVPPDTVLKLKRGEVLTLHPSLRNIGDRPVVITYGSRLFVLAAILTHDLPPLPTYTFPPASSWGRVAAWEYPNPAAVYLTWARTRTLQPGDRQNGELRVPFDSVYTYIIKVCADVASVRLCARPGFQVVVK
jgi:hypothetical protein